MPFLRFSRDKRGYEHFYLVQPSSGRGGKLRPRILYWFRTPPNVKVGREPFAEHVRRTLEAQNPDVRFDWDTLVATPIPPPEADHWRERRRAERAAKKVAEAESAHEELDADVPAEEPALTANASAADEPAPVGGGPDPLRRRRRRRRGRYPNHRPGTESAPPIDKPEGE